MTASIPSSSSPAELDTLADALGDPTRRAVFKYMAGTTEPVTAAHVGITFGIHRTVARAHLEKLVETGLLSAEFRRRPEGGRPPKVYRRSDVRLDLQMPARQYELLAELLLTMLEQFGEAAELVAKDVGFEFGRRWADTGGGHGPQECLAPLTEAGAEISITETYCGVSITRHNCLFREVSALHPGLICILDRAITDGLLSHAERPLVLREWTRRDDHQKACIQTYDTIIDRRTEDAT